MNDTIQTSGEAAKGSFASPPRKIETLGKITQMHLGLPVVALGDPNRANAPNRVSMGKIIGKATGIISKMVENKETGVKEPSRGFRGVFEATPNDPELPVARSSVLYLPFGLVGDLLDMVEHNQEHGVIATIAVEMFAQRAKNPAGYSWGLQSLLPVGTDTDPLADLHRMLAPPVEQRQIAGEVATEPLASPAPQAGPEAYRPAGKKK